MFHVEQSIINQYVCLLKKWNDKIPLTSRKSDVKDLEARVKECCELFNYINNKNSRIVDLGSGNGLPGVVLSILGAPQVTLVESNAKKCAFLLEVSSLIRNKIDIINDRIEKVGLDCDAIVSKGLASMSKIFSYAKDIVHKDILLIKGPNYEFEITNAKKSWSFDFRVLEISNNAHIVHVTNLVKINDENNSSH